MCGFTGFLTSDATFGDLNDVVATMANRIRHRGPDDSGTWSDPGAGVALAHRRLSILDLSPAGHQPMVSANGRYVVVYNGEIYNHVDLRREVDKTCDAPVWRGHSDTEVLLAALNVWGVEATLQRFVGMFAMAIWDRTDRRLYLTRDRVGEKPLYYGWVNGSFVFASELKAIRAFPGFEGTVDRDALTLYLRRNYVPAPYSIYRGISKLEPGCLLTLDLGVKSPDQGAISAPFDAPGLSIRRWWSLADHVSSGQGEPILDADVAVEQVETSLRESIGLQSIADVPLGAFLSGGVDSSAVVALMQAQSARPVQTYTIGFHEAGFDEAVYAREVAQHLGTVHTELYVTSEQTRAVIPMLPELYDEPFADSSQIPTFLVSQMARQHVTVVLSGDGGDELFGGYNRYFWGQRIWRKLTWIPFPLRRLIARLILAYPPAKWDALVEGLSPLRGRINRLGDKLHKLTGSLSSATDLDDVYRSLVSEWVVPGGVVLDTGFPTTILDHCDEWPQLEDSAHRMMYLDAMTYLPDDILCKVDRAAMGVSLETRVPMLDHRVVELAWRLPLSMKIRDGQGKWALRQVLYKYVPKKMIERPKAGFSIPVGQWLRGPLREWAEALLDPALLRSEGYFRPEPIRQRWQEHLAGTRNWEHSLWSVLMFQAWLESTT